MVEPIYLICPPGPRRDRLSLSLGSPVEPVSSLTSPEALQQRPPGLILVVSDANDDAGDARLRVAEAVVRGGHGWRLAVADVRPGVESNSLTFGPGAPQSGLRVLLGRCEAESAIARARHELNNHLMSALAEIQVLLMDVTCDELRESYDIIHAQLRAMKESVASL